MFLSWAHDFKKFPVPYPVSEHWDQINMFFIVTLPYW
jgi:hypothetical protein